MLLRGGEDERMMWRKKEEDGLEILLFIPKPFI